MAENDITTEPANLTHISKSLDLTCHAQRIFRESAQFSSPSTSKATVSPVSIQTLSFPDGSRGTFSTDSTSLSSSIRASSSYGQETSKNKGQVVVELDDGISVASYKPIYWDNKNVSSSLDERLQYQSPAWTLLSTYSDAVDPVEPMNIMNTPLFNFEREFDEIGSINSEVGNEEEVINQWKSKCKHYLILSSAGKPIYSRHGDQNLINSYIGVIQTIISFYQAFNDSLFGFTAEGTRFVISTNGPLYLVAISRLGESDSQLRAQLEALYMQILSTLTLPTLSQLFTRRPNTDLRRPLEGTEVLLSSLADSFTKGSPSALLSSIECLSLSKSERCVINNSLLKARADKLLYGLIAVGSKLVSVVRPKRHSLHPSDLQLIFNMLFESEGIKTGEGENWIPLCLPGFNNRGYLYLYVSYLSTVKDQDTVIAPKLVNRNRDKEIAIVLISTDKESFFDLKSMRDETVVELEKNGSLEVIKRAINEGRPNILSIVPGTQLRHFLYKSRINVQFLMSEYRSDQIELIARRRYFC
ncbi:Vacuolar fusion protein MON1 [Golovinomyces cichoracearum]|uniref:Vacuolar fusion protein MON1 n=1 Tax=Golovinomyces cichoracearum TaxID=62708 RepID=A0A420IHL0_9PEZI|nr:Vacuolar fusion protein MON1 [Golovinomyces cichoracearum]